MGLLKAQSFLLILYILQLAFYRLRQPQMTVYFIAYDQYFDQELHTLHSHFDELDVRPDLYLIEWWVWEILSDFYSVFSP